MSILEIWKVAIMASFLTVCGVQFNEQQLVELLTEHRYNENLATILCDWLRDCQGNGNLCDENAHKFLREKLSRMIAISNEKAHAMHTLTAIDGKAF
jgi:hypothetical protein